MAFFTPELAWQNNKADVEHCMRAALSAVRRVRSTRDETVERVLAAAWDVVKHPEYMTIEECERHDQIVGPGNRLRSVLETLAPQEKE